MIDMVNDGRGSVRLEFAIPTRGLIGLRNAFLTATKGNGVMASRLIGYEPWQGRSSPTRTGALVASETGTALTHGLANAQERGVTFIEPQTEVYEGMIVGQHPRQGDLPVNVCRAKKLTNMRASTTDIAVRLTPPVVLSLEQSLDFLADDELLEVTPKAWRLRKRYLSRRRARQRAQEVTDAGRQPGITSPQIDDFTTVLTSQLAHGYDDRVTEAALLVQPEITWHDPAHADAALGNPPPCQLD